MHPLLLHQIADDRVIGRRRSVQHRIPTRRRHRGRAVATRLRSVLGDLLITVGTRVAGPRPRPGPVGLRRPST